MHVKFQIRLMVPAFSIILFSFNNVIAEHLNKPAMTNSDSSTVSVRYIVDDVASAVKFYYDLLGFKIIMDKSPGFAMLSMGNLRLMLNKPGAGGAGQSMPDGEAPRPGGWNRIQLEVADLEAEVKKL